MLGHLFLAIAISTTVAPSAATRVCNPLGALLVLFLHGGGATDHVLLALPATAPAPIPAAVPAVQGLPAAVMCVCVGGWVDACVDEIIGPCLIVGKLRGGRRRKPCMILRPAGTISGGTF